MAFARVQQKLLKYFNSSIASKFLVPPSTVLPVIFCLNINEPLLPERPIIALASIKAGLSLYLSAYSIINFIIFCYILIIISVFY